MAGQAGIPPLAFNICNVAGFISSAVTAVSNLLLNLSSARRTPQSPGRLMLRKHSTEDYILIARAENLTCEMCIVCCLIQRHRCAVV